MWAEGRHWTTGRIFRYNATSRNCIGDARIVQSATKAIGSKSSPGIRGREAYVAQSGHSSHSTTVSCALRLPPLRMDSWAKGCCYMGLFRVFSGRPQHIVFKPRWHPRLVPGPVEAAEIAALGNRCAIPTAPIGSTNDDSR